MHSIYFLAEFDYHFECEFFFRSQEIEILLVFDLKLGTDDELDDAGLVQFGFFDDCNVPVGIEFSQYAFIPVDGPFPLWTLD